MQKIINGLLYDTETSEKIFSDDIQNRVWHMTANGNYFVFYRTGEITPKTESQAKEFLGKNDVAKYIELFGEPEEA